MIYFVHFSSTMFILAAKETKHIKDKYPLKFYFQKKTCFIMFFAFIKIYACIRLGFVCYSLLRNEFVLSEKQVRSCKTKAPQFCGHAGCEVVKLPTGECFYWLK